MQVEATASPSRASTRLTPRKGLLVLAGYGVRVSVERGHLRVADNVMGERREGLLARATARLKRLVILGHSGLISLEAMRWLHDVGAAFVQIDADGTVITVSAPGGLDDARLRRAQALAAFNGVGIALAREFLQAKLEGQRRVLERLTGADHARSVVAQAIAALPAADGSLALRVAESMAAAAYWRAWADLSVRFVTKDQDRVPDHWWTFGTRMSPLTSSPRSAANPANALLNYLYAILESETRIALLTMGLDPGMGLLHADQPNRDSLACDVMEAVRPDVDAYVLDLLDRRAFAAREFAETRTGNCRLVPPLTQQLCETALRWRMLVAPVVERLAQVISHRVARVPSQATSATQRPSVPMRKPGRQLPTPLTQAKRSAGRRTAQPAARRAEPARLASPPQSCLTCGAPLSGVRRRYCDECRPTRIADGLASFTAAGPTALAGLMADGRDPTHGGEAGRKRGQRIGQRNREAAAWEREHSSDSNPTMFTEHILPQLQAIPLSAIMQATGLSLRYCSLIRRGLRTPHPRHWRALAAFARPIAPC